MHFEIIDEIQDPEIIAVGTSIRDIARLREQLGASRWRKLKGIALVRLKDGTVRKAEIHLYEAHSIGRKKVEIKRFVD